MFQRRLQNSSRLVADAGAYGYTMEFDMQRHFRDSRAVRLNASFETGARFRGGRREPQEPQREQIEDAG